MGILFSDNFDRADQTGLGANWTLDATNYGISTNQARSTLDFVNNPSGTAAWVNAVADLADMTVQAKLKHVKVGSVDFARAGLVARRTAANTFYYFRLYPNTNGYGLAKIVSGVQFDLATGTTSDHEAYHLFRLEVFGNQLRVYRDGTLLAGPVTDSSITGSGRGGLLLCGDSDGDRGYADDFVVADAPGDPLGTSISRKFLLALESFARPNRTYASSPVEIGSGTARKFFSPVAFDLEAGLIRNFPVGVESAVTVRSPNMDIPIEWGGATVLGRFFSIPFESLRRLAFPRSSGATGSPFPVEWTAGLLRRDFRIEIEAGGGVGRIFLVPAEWTGLNILFRKFPIPVAIAAALVRKYRLEVEWSGLGLGIVHQRNVLRKLIAPFLHERIIVPTGVVSSIQHQATIKGILGGQVPHARVVLPQQVVTLFGDDIQLPTATVDKI